jgi:hypothetical protein
MKLLKAAGWVVLVAVVYYLAIFVLAAATFPLSQASPGAKAAMLRMLGTGIHWKVLTLVFGYLAAKRTHGGIWAGVAFGAVAWGLWWIRLLGPQPAGEFDFFHAGMIMLPELVILGGAGALAQTWLSSRHERQMSAAAPQGDPPVPAERL